MDRKWRWGRQGGEQGITLSGSRKQDNHSGVMLQKSPAQDCVKYKKQKEARSYITTSQSGWVPTRLFHTEKKMSLATLSIFLSHTENVTVEANRISKSGLCTQSYSFKMLEPAVSPPSDGESNYTNIC